MASNFRIGSVVFAAALGASSLAAPVLADSATLTQASKMMEQGVPVKAIELIDQALTSGKLTSDLSAKALLMRAEAQEKLGKHALAFADYNSALWQGLSGSDKGKAEKGRDRVMGKLGVEGDDSSSAPAAKPQRSATNQQAAASGAWDTDIRTTPSEERTGSTGGLGSLFGGLFGSSQQKPQEEAKPVPREAPRPAAAAAAQAERPQARQARPEREQQQERPARVVNAQLATSPVAGVEGNFAIQFAALRSEDSAIYEVERIAKRYGSDLGGRSPSVKILATSDGGTLYKIVAEPYQRGEATAICELLKTKGLDCMLISR